LTGTTITLLTKTAARYEGVIHSTSGEGDTTGLTLKDVKEISTPGASLKDQVFIASTNIDSWSSGPADAKVPNGDTFRTDSDISQKATPRRERDLQAWQSTSDPSSLPPGAPASSTQFGVVDDLTFGPGSNNTSWDQFAANEKLFGVKTNFDEDVYTTKLDRSAADFKERERKAQRIANEIIGTATSNSHVAEERNFIVDDSGLNEEDKYGAVVRGTNAYVPPGARKGIPGSAGPVPPASGLKVEVPKVSINAPDGAALPQTHAQSPTLSSKALSPAPANSNKPPADPLPAFRDFVTNEKQRLNQKRQALVKSEMDKRMAELVKFSQSFKLNKPIPDDLVPILAKDEEKQKLIREKATKDASSTHARTIGNSSSITSSTPGVPRMAPQPGASKPGADSGRKAGVVPTPAAKTTAAAASGAQKALATQKSAANAQAVKTAATAKPVNMFIQAIPPFKGSKPRQSANATVSTNTKTSTVVSGATHTSGSDSGSGAGSGSPGIIAPMSPTTAANNRLNVNASSFRPNPKGSTSPNPSVTSASASVSPKPKAESIPTAPNPFFGTRPIKKSAPVNIKDDFNPFKHNKVAEASAVSAIWPYNGKRYMQMFPPPQHQPQQHSPHMAPPGPPPMPPPSYEEDSAAQAAARGYVYAYPPYGYPGQPMMPGMAPPGPPGAYMPGPFMQPMPYPPGMGPPNGQPMYASPGMGQMPPPQAYMAPPPPSAYPPPNGAGPRPSMPPTPIPAHAHPYYHQSPQLQHAVPYPMMMPPPPAPNGPPHPYDGGPAPVPMGGVGHA
jgi:hypothetical protein